MKKTYTKSSKLWDYNGSEFFLVKRYDNKILLEARRRIRDSITIVSKDISDLDQSASSLLSLTKQILI